MAGAQALQRRKENSGNEAMADWKSYATLHAAGVALLEHRKIHLKSEIHH
jgi:hypothetical protein